MRLLQELNDEGRTIIIVTHDMNVARHASRVYHMRDGVLTEDQGIH
jgi:putative ABC transport system ATP-binding protein